MAEFYTTINDLILNALNLVNVLDSQEEPADYMITKSLWWINMFLSSEGGSSLKSGLTKDFNLNFAPNKSNYEVSKLSSADIDDMPITQIFWGQLFADNAFYPINVISDAVYNGNFRLNNLKSRPTEVYLEKKNNSSILKFYPIPSLAHSCVLRVKQMKEQVELEDRLDEIAESSRMYLLMKLAKYASNIFGSKSNWTPVLETEYQKLERDFEQRNSQSLDILQTGSLNTYSTYYFNRLR